MSFMVVRNNKHKKIRVFKAWGKWWVAIPIKPLVRTMDANVFPCKDFERALAFALQRAELSKLEL